MVVFVPRTLIDGGIYRRDWNEERRPTMVSKCDEAARSKWAAVAPVNRATSLGFSAPKTTISDVE